MRTADPHRERRLAAFPAAIACAVLAGCGSRGAAPVPEASIRDVAVVRPDSSRLHPVVIRSAPQLKPIEAKSVEGGLHHSSSTTVACATCHTTRPANRKNRSAEDLDQFHQGLKLNHGKLACVACHDSEGGYAGLHLADGTAVAFADSMQLCAQCHGPQFRDYQHGSHGGMTGYWDRTRGPRERNHCLHCHDPHAPQIAVVQPVAGPRDRFPPAKHEAQHD